MCRVLRVSASGYYAWQKRPESDRDRENRRLLTEIRRIHGKCGTYGSPKILAELADIGQSCGRHRVPRLMRSVGIHGIPNRLAQNFSATAPNQRWVSDITHIRTGEGLLYLGVILDLYSRKVVGWSTSDRLQRKLVLRALKMAVGRRTLSSGLIHHSDRGSQYASQEFQNFLTANGIPCSRCGERNCFDNAVAESFSATLKRERVHRGQYRTWGEATTDLFHYLEIFYNRYRRHSFVGNSTP